MADNKITMPSSGGGIVRYFDDYSSKIKFKPGHIIILALIIVIIMVLLHTQGATLLGQ